MKMRYSEYLQIDEAFQYSVNLQFDINNIDKIKNYIPTKDSCEVIEKYIDSIYGNFNKSTTLIGPYGKGKSHLLLVLLTIINNYNAEDEKYIMELLNKINKVSNSLYIKLSELRTKKLKYMPIIINSNYNNMNQAFLLGMNEALQRENINDLVLNTYYEIAIDVIRKWEKESDLKTKLNLFLKENDTTIKILKNSLMMYDEKYYNLFKKAYIKIMHGMEFNPLINTDLIKLYQDITYKISEKNYNGIIVVFDEFSKFLEYVGNESMMKDLKLLQDFAELSSRTGKKEQILFTCITHKTINEYIKNLKEDKVNAFKTVEGRFKEIYFNRSMEQNYEIISQTIKRTEKFNKEYCKAFEENKELYLSLSEKFNFLHFNEYEKTLFEGCYPLNPLTVYTVINLSEKIAQNERTLFTFLTDDDVYSFKSFIKKSDGKVLFNVDTIYDYFYNLFKKETDENIKKNWLKADSSLAKVENEIDRKIIKALSIIYMVNDFNLLIPNEMTLRLAVNLDEKTFNFRIQELIEKGILKYRKTNKTYDFSSVYNKEVINEIKDLVNTKFYKINEKDVLNKIIDLGYTIPRRYNQEYKMTRFFKNDFILDSEIMQLKNLNLVKKASFCDGVVLNLLQQSYEIEEIEEKFKAFDDENAILKISKHKISKDLIDSLKEFEAIEYISKNKVLDSEMYTELQLIQSEIIEFINIELEKVFNQKNICEILYLDKKYKTEKISAIVSDVCEQVYNRTPIINNEMINKDVISTPILKARNIVMDSLLLDDPELIKSETSAEATIYKSVVAKKENEDINSILKIIKDYIKKSEQNEKKSFEKLIEKLSQKPFGIRNGVLPLLLCIVIEEYKDRLVFYYKNKEIDLNSVNISKIIDEPENYYINLERGSEDKDIYVEKMLYLFDTSVNTQYREKIKILIETMKKWVLAFPRIIRELNVSQFDENEKKCHVLLKNELLKPDLNNNEFLFISVKDIYEKDNLLDIYNKINESKIFLDEYLDNYKDYIVDKTKEIFEHNSKSNINILLKKWYESIDKKINKIVVKYEIKELLEYIDTLSTFNEKEIIEDIAYIVTGRYIEDWQNNTLDEFENKLQQIMNDVKFLNIPEEKESKTITISSGNKEIVKYLDSNSISMLGNTMKNNIEDIIEEYGESIDETEKIKVILEILKKYM